MTTMTRPTFTAVRDDYGDQWKTCRGANHKDTGRLGICDSCGAEVVQVQKDGQRPYLVDTHLAGFYATVTFYCWRKHTCDPERVERYTAAKTEHIARGEIIKGARVTVVRGRKVPKGTVGTVIWLGEDNWGKARLGLRTDDGETHWTAASNCEVTA